jgi:glycosyltransferase involved in cell wall biosynthesis
MRDQPPSVAVVMTCYNEGAFIGDAVRSVLTQTVNQRIDQIVIADDGSFPDTVAVLRAIEEWDDRITVIYGEGGVGLPGQRCRAIAATSAPLLAILDGDDLWTPDKLEAQLAALATDRSVGLVYSDYYCFPDGSIDQARRAGVLNLTSAPNLTERYFLNDPPIIPSTIVLKRNSYEASGGFDPAVRVFEDTDFYLRMARVTQFALVDRPLIYKRNRSTSITGGRPDLMAHHAYVAFKAAVDEPELLRLIPRRLAERARKLGNQRFLLNDPVGATNLLALAIRLDPLNWRAFSSYLAARYFPELALTLLGKNGRRRQAALGLSN